MIPQPWKEQQVTCQCLVLTALIRGSKLSSISKKAKDKSSHEISPEAAAAWEGDARGWAEGGSDASGPADVTAPLPSLGRGSTPGAVPMLRDTCLDPAPQTSCFPGTRPMVPTCQDGTLPGRMGRKAPDTWSCQFNPDLIERGRECSPCCANGLLQRLRTQLSPMAQEQLCNPRRLGHPPAA